MTHASHAVPSPATRRFLAPALTRVLIGAAILLALVVWLRWLGRPFTCPCGTVALWDGDPHSPGASQQFADWYSALHVVLGMAFYLVFRRLRPLWPVSWILLLVIASSAIWEGVENMPWLIALFDGAENAPSYSGDSILNALGDTSFVVLGMYVARALPPLGIAAAIAGIELTIALAIHDGFVLGTLRILGV